MADNYTPLAQGDQTAAPAQQPIDKVEHPGMGLPTKESEPLAAGPDHVKAELHVEHEVPKEVAHVVEARREVPHVPKDVQQMGVQATSAPQFQTLKEVTLPISDEQVEAGLKQPLTSSFRWLAELCMYLLKQAHLTLKILHGKVIRVAEK